jgi:hypothetical protein
MSEAFRHLGLACRTRELVIEGRRNRTPFFPTQVTEVHRDEAAEVLGRLPDEHFQIFRRPLFARFDWTPSLVGRYQGSEPAAAASRAPQAVA